MVAISIRGGSRETREVLMGLARKYMPIVTINVVEEMEIDQSNYVMMLTQCNIIERYHEYEYGAQLRYDVTNRIVLVYKIRTRNIYRLVVATFKR